jgi:hypothetical protein
MTRLQFVSYSADFFQAHQLDFPRLFAAATRYHAELRATGARAPRSAAAVNRGPSGRARRTPRLCPARGAGSGAREGDMALDEYGDEFQRVNQLLFARARRAFD